MSKMNDAFDTQIERLRMRFLNDTRPCEVIRDFPEIELHGHSLGPFRRGDRITIPNWMIEILEQQQLVRISDELHFESLKKLQLIELEHDDRPHILHDVPLYLFSALSRKHQRIASDKTALDHRKYEEIQELQRIMIYLRDLRLTQIVRVARAAKTRPCQDKKNQMTLEEQWLCRQVAELISEWRSKII